MGPNSAEKLHLLIRLGRYAEAERAAPKVIADDPEEHAGYYYLAQALLCLDRYPEALEVSDRVLALAPNRWYAHAQRSALLSVTGQVAQAVEVAEAALRLGPTEPGARVRLAAALVLADRPAEATTVIAEARRLFPTDPDVLYHAGLVALVRKDMATVVEVAERGLALDPNYPGFHSLAGQGTAHQAQYEVPEGPERQQRYRVAERRLAEAVRMVPTNAEFREERKRNARDSRDGVLVKLLAGLIFGIAAALFALPIIFHVRGYPCWFFLALPVAIGFLGGLCHGIPEFSLILPLRRFDVVTVPLLPEERRLGRIVWCVFLSAVAATLFLPRLLMPLERSGSEVQKAPDDRGPRPQRVQ